MRVEQIQQHEKRTVARSFDLLSAVQVHHVSRSVDMSSFVARWQYVCALGGVTLAEADGWLKPAVAAAVLAEVDAELRSNAERANAEAARQRQEIERLGLDARAKDLYARVEVRHT